MNVIFRSNDRFSKKSLNNNAEVWVESLSKYLTEDAIVRLSLFVDAKNMATAKINISDSGININASHSDKDFARAIDGAVSKCATQLVKGKKNFLDRDTIQYNEDYDLNSKTSQLIETVSIEKRLAAMKKTSKYNRMMNKFISYLYRENDLARAVQHYEILCNMYDNLDLETISVADFIRLEQSMNQIIDEILSMEKKQMTFENSKNTQDYINQVIESEREVAKLKTLK